jgi:hypothetical protein
MMKYIILALLILVVGCTTQTNSADEQIAREHVLNFQPYKENGGNNLQLINTLEGGCDGCTTFKYSFEMNLQDLNNQFVTAHVNVVMKDGEIISSSMAQDP